ncbi:C-C motif chemokine 27a [Halichoeres trimaculatus]|uniref:C-C motif chemokine 27a n=1 Tax=Halichoeres trimaculatus TaxID=147232 RepID=UPI003D9F5183
MDVKVVFVTVCLFALAIYTIKAGIPKCCVRINKKITRNTLQKVIRWNVQDNNGACDIAAVVLYVKGRKKPVCGHPKLEKSLIRADRRKRHDG